ncbi:hypothetical protein [Hymenobacter crusticola]|uniref:hypothetical protein n=1 Tax=Hymenobacter crusticola TaxID=1770526 RepID=UPI00117BB88D|nr:hypothetical protein [Hymenobacter crusticola]
MPAKLTTKGWIARARAVHGSRYDYSLVVYRAAATVVVIGCGVHGRFAQAANHHLLGQGCPACAVVAQAQHDRQKNASVPRRAGAGTAHPPRIGSPSHRNGTSLYSDHRLGKPEKVLARPHRMET